MLSYAKLFFDFIIIIIYVFFFACKFYACVIFKEMKSHRKICKSHLCLTLIGYTYWCIFRKVRGYFTNIYVSVKEFLLIPKTFGFFFTFLVL